MERKPSASPVCYAEDKDIDPAYMWAQPKRATRAQAKPKPKAAKTTKPAIRKGNKR